MRKFWAMEAKLDQAAIIRKVQFGYGKAASIVGAYCAHWRPLGPSDPISTWPMEPVWCAFDINFTFPFTIPANYRTDVYAGLFSTATTIVGDYIIDPGNGVFFIINQEVFKAPMCVLTNQTLTFLRPGSAPSGPGFYGGDETATEVPLLTHWPCAVSAGTKGERGDAGLPEDPRDPWVQILLPSVGGVQLRYGDIAIDDQAIPQRYVLSSCELTSLGYRLTASLAVT